MLYTIIRSIDTYTITNTSGTPIIVQVEYSADCNDNENFSVLNPTVTLNTNDTTSFTMTSDGIYKVDIEDTVLNSSGTYQLDTKYFTKYDTLLNSFISDVEYSFVVVDVLTVQIVMIIKMIYYLLLLRYLHTMLYLRVSIMNV